MAASLDTPVTFDISAQSLDTALLAYSRQSGIQVVSAGAALADKRAPALHAVATPRVALAALLKGTRLSFDATSKDTVTIVPLNAAAAAAPNAVQRAAVKSEILAVAEPPPPAAAQVAEVVVTGSNIRRAEAAALPVTVVGQNQFLARDASTPIDLLQSLPQVPTAPLNESANGSFSARGDFAAVNLRGIGTGNTLVLLGGRRLAPHPISSTDEAGLPQASVNVNQLPTQGVDHVEVLRDGASSIYGTDAVAGVVNYILKKDFEGLDLHARATANEHGDGQEWEGAINYGASFADGRGHFSSLIDIYDRNPIFLRDRWFSAPGDFTFRAPPPWNAPSSLIPLSADLFYKLQAAGAYPSYKVGTSSVTTYVVPQVAGGVQVTTTQPVRDGAGGGYYFDNNAYQAIQPQSTRVNWFNQADYEFNPHLTAFGELSYYHADSTLMRQPISYNGGSFVDKLVVVPASSPYNPYGQPVSLLTKILMDVGPEKDTISDQVFRILGGLRGDFGSRWTWETAAYYTQANVTDIGHNAVRESLFDQAVASGSYNPFGYTFTTANGVVTGATPYVNPQSAITPFLGDFRRNGQSSIASVDFRTTGKVFDIWSGSVSLAVGGELRREGFSFSLPPYSGLNPPGSGLPTDDNDFILFAPAANWSASRTVGSLYGETVIPLARPDNNIPFVHSLELTASGRFENYSDFGSTVKPKVGLSWRPESWMMVRASYNEGFRAPNLPLLDGGQRKNLTVFLDPLTNVSGPRWTIFAGNPNLKPEQSTGKSLGVVFDGTPLHGFTFSVDYWEIAQSNLITTTSVTDILASDASRLQPIVAANPSTPFSQLNFGSGTTAYKGDPRVIRNADNTIYGVTTPPFNSAHAFVSGLDISASYRSPDLPIGRFSVRSDAANIGQDYLYASPTALKDNKLGRDGITPWRVNGSINWQKDGWSAGFSAFYIGAFQDSSVTLPTTSPSLLAQSTALYQSLGSPRYIATGINLGQVYYRYVVPSTTTFNMFVGYDFRDSRNRWLTSTAVRLGVVNLTNVVPPVDGTPQGYTTTVYNSLVAGRTWTLDISRKF